MKLLLLLVSIFTIFSMYISISNGVTLDLGSEELGPCVYKASDNNNYDLNNVGYLELTKLITPADGTKPFNRTYGLNLCKNLLTDGTNVQICSGQPTRICQQDVGNKTKTYNLANPVNPITQLTSAGSLVSLQYGGQLCSMTGIKTIVNLNCGDENKILNVTGGAQKEQCSNTYTINVQSSVFCPSTSPGKGGLSGGDIFLILFFCGFGAYFIFGTAFLCYRGKRGTEAIPNLGFWAAFGSLIKDGVFYIKGKITGSATSGGYNQI